MTEASASSSSRSFVRAAVSASLLLGLAEFTTRSAHAENASSRPIPGAGQAQGDGVYGRFDGDLDLGLALGVEFGSAGQGAPALRGTAHYFSIAGVYATGRIKASDESAPSLFGLGVDLRPLFVPRWVKGYQAGPALFDLTLDSLS